MRKLLVLLLFLPILAFGQTTCPNTSPPGTTFNVTQPFHFFFDMPNGMVVDHFVITVTPTLPAGAVRVYNIGIPASAPSTNTGCTTFSQLADSTLAVGNFTASASACPAASATGCATSGTVLFVINTPPPPPISAPGNLQAK